MFECGIGRGSAPSPIHVVFVARDPATSSVKVVGLYAAATTKFGEEWSGAATRTAQIIPVDRRPKFPVKWDGQGIRRWAFRDSGHTHPSLFRYFNFRKAELPTIFARKLPESGCSRPDLRRS